VYNSDVSNPSFSRTQKTVYLVRHGQTAQNIQQVFQGTGAKLNAEGIKQAEFLAERVSHLSFGALIASPLPRTRQTAEIIAMKTNHEIEFSDLSIEHVKPQSLYNQPYDDPEATDLWKRWVAGMNNHNVRVEDGENYSDVTKQIKESLEFLRQHQIQVLLVVTHGRFLRTIMACSLLGDNITPSTFQHVQRALKSRIPASLLFNTHRGSMNKRSGAFGHTTTTPTWQNNFFIMNFCSISLP
jgi:broad specificity phosphatase PhoE